MVITNAIAANSPVPAPLVPNASSATSSGLSFGDLVDAVNPLQHVPVLSGLYRAATGSSISTFSRLAGDTIYGLALGGGTLASAAISAASSAADSAVQAVSGSDVGGHIVNTLSSITSANPGTGTPLVPNPSGTVVATAQPATFAPEFFPMDRHPQATAAQYSHATIMDAVNQKLLKIS